MNKSVFVGALVATVLAVMPALADDTGVTIVMHDGVRTQVMKDQIIVGRALRPLAVHDVAKLPMRSTLTELRQPFVQRIADTVQRAPF